MNNFTAFRKFEHDFWNVTSDPYDQGFGHVTSQAIPHLIEHITPENGSSLLDIACGPGYLTEKASSLAVTGIDFSESMISLAQNRSPKEEFKVADAQNLPFENESFDNICSNFGMLHFSNAQQVIAETYRTIKPGGRFVFSVWNHLEHSPAMNLLMQAVGEYANTPVDLPEGPDFFYFANKGNSFAALEKANFKNPRQTTHQISWPIPNANDYIKYFRDGGARIGAILRAQNDETLDKIIAHIKTALTDYPNQVVPTSIVITSAEK